MKTQNNLLVELNSKELVKLTTTVKETIATTVQLINSKTIFGTADLWNIQRMRRARMPRRLFS